MSDCIEQQKMEASAAAAVNKVEKNTEYEKVKVTVQLLVTFFVR